MEDNLSRLAQQQAAHVLLLAVSQALRPIAISDTVSPGIIGWMQRVSRRHKLRSASVVFLSRSSNHLATAGALLVMCFHQHALIFGVGWPLCDSAHSKRQLHNCLARSVQMGPTRVEVTTVVCKSHTGLGPGSAMHCLRPARLSAPPSLCLCLLARAYG